MGKQEPLGCLLSLSFVVRLANLLLWQIGSIRKMLNQGNKRIGVRSTTPWWTRVLPIFYGDPHITVEASRNHRHLYARGLE
jgi:hypothetical protein